MKAVGAKGILGRYRMKGDNERGMNEEVYE